MYVDNVVIFGVVIIVLTCAVLVGVGRHALRHFKEDVARAALADQQLNGQTNTH